MATRTAPNLDELNLDCESTDPRDLEHIAHWLERLSKYAAAKAEAMQLRAQGDIAGALAAESRCDSYYAALPLNWRW